MNTSVGTRNDRVRIALLATASLIVAACGSETNTPKPPSFRWDQPSYTIAAGTNEVSATGRAIPGDEPLPDTLTFGIVPLDNGISGHYQDFVVPTHCAAGCAVGVTFVRTVTMTGDTVAPGTYHVRVGFAVNAGGQVQEYADDVAIVVE